MYYKEPESDYPFFPGIEMDNGFSYIDNIMSGEPYESLESRLQRQNEACRAVSAANSTQNEFNKTFKPITDSLRAAPKKITVTTPIDNGILMAREFIYSKTCIHHQKENL